MENRAYVFICICILGVVGVVGVFLFSPRFDKHMQNLYSVPYRIPPPSRAPSKSPSPPPSTSPEPKWEDPGPYHVAYPRNYKFIMDDTPTCRTTTPFLILMVPVAPGDKAARDAIRKTWGNEKLVLGQVVETLFIIGLPGGADAEQQQEKLREENLQHRDLIQSNFQDSYRNLTVKTMVMLEWLAAHCVKASYVIKTDSDVFLHIQNLVKLLLEPSTAKQNYMSGLVWWNSPVLRNPLTKSYMPRTVVAESEYPPYPLGMAY